MYGLGCVSTCSSKELLPGCSTPCKRRQKENTYHRVDTSNSVYIYFNCTTVLGITISNFSLSGLLKPYVFQSVATNLCRVSSQANLNHTPLQLQQLCKYVCISILCRNMNNDILVHALCGSTYVHRYVPWPLAHTRTNTVVLMEGCWNEHTSTD